MEAIKMHAYIQYIHSYTHMHSLTHTLPSLTDLTAQHNAHMLTCDFTPENATSASSPPDTHSSSLPPPPPPPPTPPSSQSMEPSTCTDVKNNLQAEPHTNSGSTSHENGVPPDQGSSSGSSTQPSRGFVHRRLSLTVTCFAWLPALVKTELNDKATSLALVAMATRLGHVILMGVEVPLDSGW